MTIHSVINKFRFSGIRPAIGAVLMLHSIDKQNPDNIWENECLKFSADSFRDLVVYARSLGFEFVSVQELLNRIRSKRSSRKCLCVTIDDGYRNVYENGYPCFRELNIPVCINITTGIPDGKFIFWWHLLEEILQSRDSLSLSNGMHFDLSSQAKKNEAFCDIRKIMLEMKQYDPKERMADIFNGMELDFEHWINSIGLTWKMISQMNDDPLITIANHTENHLAFSACTGDEIYKELYNSQKTFADKIGFLPDYFAYPYGSVTEENIEIIKQFGFKTVMTVTPEVITHKSNVFSVPRFAIHEKNWKYIINHISSKCHYFSR